MRLKPLMFLITAAVVVICSNCTTIKPYEKEFLVHPLMDDAFTNDINPSYARTCVSRFEHLSLAAGSGSGAKSCPTCGG